MFLLHVFVENAFLQNLIPRKYVFRDDNDMSTQGMFKTPSFMLLSHIVEIYRLIVCQTISPVIALSIYNEDFMWRVTDTVLIYLSQLLYFY